MNSNQYVHLASTQANVSAATAFAFLSDPQKLALWAVGMKEQQVIGTNTVSGVLVASGEQYYCRIDANPALHTIVYRLGASLDNLAPRIMMQVMAGEVLGNDPNICVLSMLAWRSASMDNQRWHDLQTGHEAEILEIRRLLEIT